MEKTELSNEMLSILFKKAPDVIFLYDQDGNEEAEKLTGYKRDELRGRSFLNIDGLRIMQVIVNLLSNASKFSPLGSQILLDITESGDSIRFTVSDTGVGISEEDIPKLFMPFPGILVEGNVSGTGLGLSKGIVELHGGKIWAESDGIGKGTTISFSLPQNNS